MDIGSILLILALFILVALFIARPLLDHKQSRGRAMQGEPKVSAQVTTEEQAYFTLLAERDRVLNALQELDFDYTLGKIPEEDYPGQRAGLVQRGATILRQIDAITQEEVTSAEARLEAAIAARRITAEQKVPEPNGVSQADDPLEAMIAARRRSQAKAEKAAGFCARCGNPLQKSDRFCPKCGEPSINP